MNPTNPTYDIKIEDLPEGFRPVADAIGMTAALSLIDAVGGDAVYVPKADKVCRLARNRAIREQFTGGNHRELARQHNLSVVMVRRILDDQPTRHTGIDIIDRQRPLFDF